MRKNMVALDKFHRAAIHHRHLHWEFIIVVVSVYEKTKVNLLEIVQAHDSIGSTRPSCCSRKQYGS